MPEISFTVSEHSHAYLKWLSKNVILENTENQVARHLTMDAIERMRRKYGPPEPHAIHGVEGGESGEGGD